jgi:hypothetical protein
VGEVLLEEQPPGALLEVGRRGAAVPDLGGRGGVGKGTQHRGHVAQGRALLAALEQRPGRFPLEVDDQPAAGDMERLPEVEVAVGADLASP